MINYFLQEQAAHTHVVEMLARAKRAGHTVLQDTVIIAPGLSVNYSIDSKAYANAIWSLAIHLQ